MRKLPGSLGLQGPGQLLLFRPGWGGSCPGPRALSVVLTPSIRRRWGVHRSPRQVGCSAPRREDWTPRGPCKIPRLPSPPAGATLTYPAGAQGAGALFVGAPPLRGPTLRPSWRGADKGFRMALLP